MVDLIRTRSIRVGVIVGGLGDGGELERERQLEVGFGDDLGLERIELFLVLKRSARVGDRIRVP